jgi:hypothetical protein
MDIEKCKMCQKIFRYQGFNWDKGCLTTSFNDITFTKAPLSFHNIVFLVLNFFVVIDYY